MNRRGILLVGVLVLLWSAVQAQTTAFTYQGRLNNNGLPANGNFDLSFQLVNANTNVVAGPVTNSPVWVTNGLFTVSLDFGSAVFGGTPQWLVLGVRPTGQSVPFTILQPFQPLTATPYAVHALTSADAAQAVQAATNQVNTYFSNNIVPTIAGVVKATTNLSALPFVTVSPHGIADHYSSISNCGMMFGIDTPGTVTGGLQEAVNALNALNATNINAPAGGKIEIAPGTVCTFNTVYFQGTNCTYVLEGAGLSASGILYMGTASVPVLYFSQPTNFGGLCPQIFIRDLFVAATNDIQSYLVETSVFGKIGIEDCWFGFYPFMAYGNGYNGQGPWGFEPPSNGGPTAANLCGLYLEGGSVDDIAWINNCDFGGLACGLLNDCDHSVVDNNMFLYCGVFPALPNLGSLTFEDSIVSLASLGVCIVQGHSTHMNCRYRNNYFYGGNFAYAMDDSYGPDSVVSDGDGFESMSGDLFISPQSRFTQIDPHGNVPESAAINSSYMGDTLPYTVINSDPNESIRTVTLNNDNASFTGYQGFNFAGGSVNFPPGTAFSGNGYGLTVLNADQLVGFVPLNTLTGVTTNYTMAGGPTLYITNGLIMKVK